MKLDSWRWLGIPLASLVAGVIAAWSLPALAAQFIFQFRIADTNTVENPEVLVGFNPQPDPPGAPATIVSYEKGVPVFGARTAKNRFAFTFAVRGAKGTPYRITYPPGPCKDGVCHATANGPAGSFDIALEIGSTVGVLNEEEIHGFNPQPDPPGFQDAAVLEFSIVNESNATVVPATVALHISRDGTAIGLH